jgi:hypothetical protein
MARGNSTRRNLAESEISKLIRGDKDALQAQANKGGNTAPAQPTAQAPTPTPAPTPAPTPVAPNPAQPTTQALSPQEVAELQAQMAADAAKEQAMKDYFKNLQQKGEFDSEQAAEAAREAAFKAWVEGQRSLAEAAAMAAPKSAAKAAQKAGLANANAEEKAGKKKKGEGKQGGGKQPWYLRSGRGPAGIIFGGGRGNIDELNLPGGAQQEVLSEALTNLRRKAGVSKSFLLGKAGGAPPAAPSGPSK